MRVPHEQTGVRCCLGERGGARLNFVLIVAAIAVVGYSVYQYAPVAYSAFKFRDFMQETVDKAAFPPGQTLAWVETQLRAGAREQNIPPGMTVDVRNVEGRIVARVQWMHPIQLPGFVYDYNFDHTARSSGFINPQ